MSQYRDFKAHADLFAGFAVTQGMSLTIGEDTIPEIVTGMRVSADFFPLFGVLPVLGRFGTPEEDVVGRDHVLVLSQSFWESKFNADPSVIGREVLVGAASWTIIGIAPRSLEAIDVHTDFFKPFGFTPSEEDSQLRYTGTTQLLGRLKPAIAHATALNQLAIIDRRFVSEEANPPMRADLEKFGHAVALDGLGVEARTAVRLQLYLLQGGT